jgi:LPXTG-motif cell wall-anchored protein
VWDLVDRIVGWLGDIFGGLAGLVWSSSTVLTKDNTWLFVIVLLLGLLLFLMLRRRR